MSGCASRTVSRAPPFPLQSGISTSTVQTSAGARAVGDSGEAAAPGADVPEDHEGGGQILEALADVGTAGLLTNRAQVQGPEQPLEPHEVLAARGADLEPLRLSDHRRLTASTTGSIPSPPPTSGSGLSS